ncbi:MAG: M48 family metalloprotease [Candidatus Micrarchaeia archaeon]
MKYNDFLRKDYHLTSIKFITLLLLLFISGCQISKHENLIESVTKIPTRISETSPSNKSYIDSLVDEKQFDLYCNSFIREKMKLIEVYNEMLGEKLEENMLNGISTFSSQHLERKFRDLFEPRRDMIIYAYLNYPFLPDPVENLIKDVFMKSVFTANTTQILKPDKYKKLHDFLYKRYSKIANILVMSGVPRDRLKNIKIYIYDDGTKSINAFAVPGGQILISKELVRRAYFKSSSNQKQRIFTYEQEKKFREKLMKPQNYLSQVEYSIIFLDFTIAHELTHLLKRHDLMKIQSFLINPFLNENYETFKSFRSLHEGVALQEKILSENFMRANQSNTDRLRKLMKIYEFEADACATKILLTQLHKEEIIDFLDAEFRKVISDEVEISKSDKTSLKLKIAEQLENAAVFVKNFLRTETEEHLNLTERILHIRQVIEKTKF